MQCSLDRLIAPSFYKVHNSIEDYTHFWLCGGRGSTKSSFVSVEIILGIMKNADTNAVVLRKVGAYLKDSVFSQLEWAIEKLGVSDMWDIKASVPEIVYKKTGQKILFRGADKVQKLKSTKVTHGYIRYIWYEELDEFCGMKEIRSINQSMMRGGEKFTVFYSYNPPQNRRSWVNREVLKKRDDMLVHKSTYLDVPKDWLGEQFFDEAEQLKQCNPRAYAHEYLGQAVGTGGNVFENVEHMDMGVMVEVGDGYKPLYTTFSNIYNGLDWGFAKDPTQFVRMHLDTKKHDLYIFDEYRTYGTRNIEIFDALYKGKKKHIGMNELLTADSAEQKSIADFKAYGAFIRAAEKGPDSVRYGIKWLQSLNHIYIDKRRCPETFKEFVRYEYERDRDDNIISQYPDKDNHSIDATRYALERFYKRKGN